MNRLQSAQRGLERMRTNAGGDALAPFHSCPECGAEGFAEELADNKCCQGHLREVQL